VLDIPFSGRVYRFLSSDSKSATVRLTRRVDQVEPGKPGQFCNPMNGLTGGTPLFVTGYPTAWRIENVDDVISRIRICPVEDERCSKQRIGPLTLYIRFYWGPAKKTWDLPRVHKATAHG